MGSVVADRGGLARAVSDVWHGGAGPTHADLDRLFDLFDLPGLDEPGSKRDRVYSAVSRVPEDRLGDLVFRLLELAEEGGSFTGEYCIDDRTLKVLRKRIAPLHITITSTGSVVGGPGLGVDPDAMLDTPAVQEHVKRVQC